MKPRLGAIIAGSFAAVVLFFSSLYRVGYDGDIIIEHEDRGFEGTVELVQRGFLIARDTLRPWIK